MTDEQPQHAVMAAAANLQRREAQLLAREWLTHATHLADITGRTRITAAQKLNAVAERTRTAIEKNARAAIHQFGPGQSADSARSLAVSAVVETALALEARDLLTDAEFERLILPWATVVGRDLINPTPGA